MGIETKHWASRLSQGDQVLATIRHETDGSKNIHNVELIVDTVNSLKSIITGFDRSGQVYAVSFNELTAINPIPEAAFDSPALMYKSDKYPHNRHGKVPLRVVMKTTVTSDLPDVHPDQQLTVHEGFIYYVWCNSHGAVSAILPKGEMMGLMPHEYTVTQWHE